jgi:poly-beta-1,6-N-acetyl-D-glucosamine biosynthesis protein PgaD
MESVIIEASDRLAWHKRLASQASTAALWGGWVWLWAPLFRCAGKLARMGSQVPTALDVLPAAAPILPISVAAFAGTVAWRALPRAEAKLMPALLVSEYARRFELPEHVIEAGRNASICVVRHDADGCIVSIECREPAARAGAGPAPAPASLRPRRSRDGGQATK